MGCGTSQAVSITVMVASFNDLIKMQASKRDLKKKHWRIICCLRKSEIQQSVSKTVMFREVIVSSLPTAVFQITLRRGETLSR